MKKLKTRACTQERMQSSNYRKFVSPMSFSDEKFIQISTLIPEIKDYYWISNHGRIYTRFSDSLLSSDLVRERTHTTFSLKNNSSKVFDIREIYYQAFGKYYN